MTNRRLNILFFSNEPVRGGVEEHMLMLMRRLDRGRFCVHLVCHPDLANKLQPDLPGDVDVTPLYFEKPTQFAAARRFAAVLRQRRVDILHSHLFRASLVASPVAWLCRVPVILETPHVRELWRTGWVKGNYVIDRLAGRAVTSYIAVSQANGRYLIETKGLPARKVRVIENGCDLTRFHPGHQPAAGLRQSLGFGDRDPVLVVPGRLEPQKGHRVLIEALPAIRDQFPAVRLVCVGGGSLRQDLENQVRAAGLEESVRFVGYQSNVQEWLALSDMAVLPSFFEGLPLVAIESLAAGRTLVATAVDGTPEIVLDGKTGLTVPSDDPTALAKAICRLLSQPEMRNRMAENGRAWVLENFSAERFIERTQQFYLDTWDECCTGQPDRRPAPVPASERHSSV